jgi:outer membrane beta-barrel protein
MKTFKTLSLIVSMSLLLGLNASAQDTKTTTTSKKKINVSQDIDGLGGNDALMDMAEALHPETRARIVQDRLVDRNMRFEFGINYGAIVGGDSYVNTQNFGAQIDFHINPRWSLGVRYYDFSNSLSSEGQRVFTQYDQDRATGRVYSRPDIDYAYNERIAVVNWYPIYGKTSLLDMGVAQFDFYLVGGGGQIELETGTTGVWTGGLGMGLWISKHITARLEGRYQNYTDQISTGSRNINSFMGTVGFGFLL